MIDEDTPVPPSLLPDAALRRSAFRLSARTPAFVGYWLARLRERERLSEDDLARRLGVSGGRLDELALCLSPRADHFDHDLHAIAARFAADPAVLAAVVRGESPLVPTRAKPANSNSPA
jgi:hypothetical protein